MPRIPKPFPHRGWFITNVGGKRGHKLCRVEEGRAKAERLLRVYLGQLAQAEADGRRPRPVGSGIQPAVSAKLAGEAHDEFLDLKKGDDPLTYRHYVDKLKPFVERFGHRPLASLTEQDGADYKRWLLTEKPWVKGGKRPGQKSAVVRGVGPTTCNHFLRAAKTLLNWAAKPKRGYLPANPWQDIRLLTEKPRERLLTDDEFRHLTEQASDDDFRELLFFLRHSTARPGEARMVEWDMVDWDNHRVQLDPRRVKTRRARSFTLLPEVEAMLRARRERTGGRGRIFLNAKGEPWDDVSFSQRFRRLRNRCVRLGLVEAEKKGERLVLYSTRHTRNVEMIRDEDVDLAIASKEMGHANVGTTVKHYLHLTDRDVTDAVRAKRKLRE